MYRYGQGGGLVMVQPQQGGVPQMMQGGRMDVMGGLGPGGMGPGGMGGGGGGGMFGSNGGGGNLQGGAAYTR